MKINFESLSFQRNLTIFLWVVISVACTARFLNLDQKLVWGDEVFSSLRIAGITTNVFSSRLAAVKNKVITAKDLRNIVKPDGNSSYSAVINSLAVEDAQHPPLIPLLQFGWSKLFGSDPSQQRFLSATLGCLGILFIFLLALELFDPLTASIAAFFMALSPFQLI